MNPPFSLPVPSLFPRPFAGRLTCVLLALVLTSCTVGPVYQRPSVPVASAYKSASPGPTAGPQLDREWWKLFHDPELDRMEAEALGVNQTVAAAMAVVAQARAAVQGVSSGYYPTLSFNPSVTAGRTSSNVTPGSPGRNAVLTTLPFDLSYEVDLWGQLRHTVEAANAQLQASLDNYEVVRQTLTADLAADYFTLHSYDAQYQTLVDTVASYQKQLDLTQLQYRAGLESASDVASAEALLDATKTQLLEVGRERDEEEFAIAILLNQAPVDVSLARQPFNPEPPVIPAGLPADLLRRRPDVAEAEANLAAASAQIGVAASAYYPQLSLTGAAGYESTGGANLLNWSSRVWSLGPSLSLPIFNGGKLDASLAQQKAVFDQQLALYRSQVLTAYQDVENALTDLHSRADEAQAQDAAVKASQDYLRLTNLQFQQGLVDYLTVIDADRTLLSNQLADAQIRNQRLVSTVLLIKALGGGWSGSAPQR